MASMTDATSPSFPRKRESSDAAHGLDARSHGHGGADDRELAQSPRGDVAIADVESLNYDGRGVARIDGKVTFIEGALPGERVQFRYHNKRPSFDTGAVQAVLSASPDRVSPPCPHFGVCGGCSLQHLAPAAQIAALQHVLAETLAHVGRVQPERWLAPLAGPAHGYRRRARLGVRNVPKKGGVLVGFREKRRSFITPLDTCVTLDARVNDLLPALRELIAGLSIPDRLPQIEVACGDDVVTLVFRHLRPLTEADRERLTTFAHTHAVQVYLQAEGPESATPLAPSSPRTLQYRLPEYDVTLSFQPTDFIQVNGAVNRQLVRQALTLLDLKPSDRVLDLFCGLGNFTLAAARTAARVIGMEAEAGLVERARGNAAANGIANAEFTVADLYAANLLLPRFTEEGAPFKLLLDPPRAGAIEVLKCLAPQQPQRVVYVSCNPATLARDAEYLVNAAGYRFEAAGVADMFPHTSHVESIALFTRA